LLADAARGPLVWKALARQMGAQALRMNLNTLLRHGVFEDRELADWVAVRLADTDEIRRSRQFPYQYLAAYLNADHQVPLQVRTALGQAAELACGNIPELPGPVIIGVDTSGSMSSPVTGYRGQGATTKVRCVEVAGLFAAAILRRNPDSVVIPFDTQAYQAEFRAEETILHTARRLAAYGGGGTNCSLPLVAANTQYRDQRFAGCVLVSDMESWVGTGHYDSTAVLTEWERFVRNQRRLADSKVNPKLVCINLQAYTTTQAPERADVLNVGGFSDAVFNLVTAFLDDDSERFVREVEAMEL
jgi:60 kDa SS-A/Ro ribonucleoprotein